MRKITLTSFILTIITLMLVLGCKGEDGQDGADGLDGADGQDGSMSDAVLTTSGFAIYDDAIFIAPDANDGDNITDAINLAIFDAFTAGNTGATFVLPKGNFIVDDTITITNANGLTLTGYGINETKLDFSSASSADDAIRFEGGIDITIRDFGVYEASKNGIKVVGANGVHIAYTATVWEGELDDGNGAYGLYPLNCTNVLIENSFARGSADAGIYVGQSSDIVVRRNVAKENVAGIEIENSFNADVYDNLAVGNTGGILTFDLPGLTQAFGGNVRIFGNELYANNAENFAGGGAVSIVPPGTGLLIFATSNVEVYNNNFTDNETSSIEIASYFLSDSDVASYVVGDGSGNYEAAMANGWSPLVKNAYVHHNTIQRSGANPRGNLITDIVNGYTLVKGETMPAVLYGGIGQVLDDVGAIAGFGMVPVSSDASARASEANVDLSYDGYSASELVCVSNNYNANSAADALDFPDVNIGQVYTFDPTTPDLASETLQGNTTLVSCSQSRLPVATVTFKGKVYGCAGDDMAAPSCSL
ncbi:parallel beta-helix domain-containing protein [Pleionea sediminis]|uniref:parallel beta-helix domain-containing protein n=1 Tax=Pleionea sediminis TaxID=2569479 RepID=UPI0011858937|nr:parallel beta-helix domain-containing protein [Pleionea sediminis]